MHRQSDDTLVQIRDDGRFEIVEHLRGYVSSRLMTFCHVHVLISFSAVGKVEKVFGSWKRLIFAPRCTEFHAEASRLRIFSPLSPKSIPDFPP